MRKIFVSICFYSLIFLSCSSENTQVDPIATQMEEEILPEPNVYQDVNQQNLVFDISQMFLTGNNLDNSRRGGISGGTRIPYTLSFSLIRKEHFNGLTPESVEARKTLEIHSIAGQSSKISGKEDIEVVGFETNEFGIGFSSITYVIDRDDDDLVPNGTMTIIESLEVDRAGLCGFSLNCINDYNSNRFKALELEFALDDGAIGETPSGSDIQVLGYKVNLDIEYPHGLLNANYNTDNSVVFFDYLDSAFEYYINDENTTKVVPINIIQVNIGDGKTDNIVTTRQYDFSD